MNSLAIVPYTPEPCLEHAIRTRAYYIYVERGKRDGQALDDWVEAERQVHKEMTGIAKDVFAA